MKNFKSLSFEIKNNELSLLDQTQLPHKEVWIKIRHFEDFASCVKELKVRGAPLIGLSASAFLALEEEKGPGFLKNSPEIFEKIKKLRPTAVNVMYSMNLLRETPSSQVTALVEQWMKDDKEACEKMSAYGAELLFDGDNVLTYCNTGGLATLGRGTALGVLTKAFETQKKFHVYVPETRPLLQGARLTAWELQKDNIPYTLICDNMVASLIADQKIQKVFLGADRICKNGDFANKIGTLSLAVLADHYKIPFYVVAPWTTYDEGCPSGKEIPVEQRGPQEVLGDWSLSSSKVYNPAFDVTPHRFVTGWITESGVYDHKSWCLKKNRI